MPENGVPEQFEHAGIVDALGDLGITVDSVPRLSSIKFDFKNRQVTIEQIRNGKSGHFLVAGEDVATVTTVVGIV